MNPRAELETIRERHEFAEGFVINGESPRTGQTHKDRARLLDAVEKVLELHKPMGATDEVFCSACFDPDWTSPDDNNYPCPTVRAITTALEGK